MIRRLRRTSRQVKLMTPVPLGPSETEKTPTVLCTLVECGTSDAAETHTHTPCTRIPLHGFGGIQWELPHANLATMSRRPRPLLHRFWPT